MTNAIVPLLIGKSYIVEDGEILVIDDTGPSLTLGNGAILTPVRGKDGTYDIAWYNPTDTTLVSRGRGFNNERLGNRAVGDAIRGAIGFPLLSLGAGGYVVHVGLTDAGGKKVYLLLHFEHKVPFPKDEIV